MVFEFIVLVSVLLIISIYLLIKNVQWKLKFEQRFKDWIEKEEQRIRQDAITRSARTLSGKTLEKLVPFLDRFPYDPHDVRWLGDPIDLVIFDGYSSKGTPEQIVFCEVKSGESKLSKIQTKIKELVESKRIKWLEFKP